MIINLSIRKKMLLGFGMIFFLIALFSTVSILSVSKIDRNSGFVKDISYSHAIYLIELENLVKQVAGHVSSSIDSGYYIGMQKAKDIHKILDEKFAEADVLFADHADILEAVRGLKPKIDDFVAFGDKYVRIILEQRWAEVAGAQKIFYTRQDDILASIAGIKALGVKRLDSSIADISRLTKNTLYITTVIMLITLLSGISLAYFTGYQVVHPIQRLMDVMKEAEKGNFAVRSHIVRHDELGSLAIGFNEMLAHIQKRDAELELHRHHLEELVARRTSDLEKANKLLHTELTERKRAEAALEQINEEMKNFAYIVSHDLRAPLVNIKGFSDELNRSIKEIHPLLEKYLDRVGEKDKQRTEELLKKDIPEALVFIGSSVTRMDALINSILKLSRLGRNELKPELVRTKDIVQTLLESLTHQIDMHKAEVTIGHLPDIIMDKTAAEQLFGNLLDNALKYLEPSRPGKIEITAKENAGDIQFTIRDNGRGIAKEDTLKVFELFRRVGRQDVPGEGMGLTYVNTLVRRLGGRIWCESELGAGTAFKFTIPNKVHTENRI
jgi:signal transduction histidine kinase